MRLWALGLLVLAATSCRNRTSDLPVWTPQDHSHEGTEGQRPATDPGATPEDDDTVIAAQGVWLARCATCHGEEGRGDGPQAPLTHPPDLTSAAFQTAWSDGALADTIARGRNMMPAFGGDIRPEGIHALVLLTRTLVPRPAEPQTQAPTPAVTP